MKIVSFTVDYQEKTEIFLKEIYDEMGWKDQGGELTNLYQYFHLPTGGLFLIVREGGEIVGTAGCLKLDEKEGLIKRFYIKKNLRGFGVAQGLIKEVLKKAKEMNLSRVVLDVSKTNKRAIHFYEKNGFLPYKPAPIDVWHESFQPETHDYYYKLLRAKARGFLW